MRPRVVIVDADAAMQGSLRTLLSTLDVDVVTHDCGEAFLAHMRKQIGHVTICLIVDVSLPDMSGLDLLRRIRAVDLAVPVVLLASEAEVPMAVEAMRHGATDFIEKAQVDISLLRRISQLLRSAA
jgi:two-component system response regulator FixJ